MHIDVYTEEDFRFATLSQVRNYSPDEFYVKPHLPGFALTHLYDWLNGHILKENQPRILIRAVAGTAYWVAQHVVPQATVDLWLSADQQNACSRYQFAKLAEPMRLLESDSVPSDGDCSNVTCVVLACWVPDSVNWYNQIRAHSILGCKPMAVYDPDRRLRRHPEGEYFFNSSIWVVKGRVA